ncbi:hypothetical protein FPZ24_02070 [Sphingomonas panacisoli]|uniref:Uncharacterized protein n=1 Tax=Sphingomonas panacisoli TaxID=1813879 RepID=A0A5B8LEW4_9SPHN|nr:hypothetical protein [Sphingomonas panacisoli]QDZ06409.1 hypothetical protein FPZ24_02070 [Sphingomonas panacisoli]
MSAITTRSPATLASTKSVFVRLSTELKVAELGDLVVTSQNCHDYADKLMAAAASCRHIHIRLAKRDERCSGDIMTCMAE